MKGNTGICILMAALVCCSLSSLVGSDWKRVNSFNEFEARQNSGANKYYRAPSAQSIPTPMIMALMMPDYGGYGSESLIRDENEKAQN